MPRTLKLKGIPYAVCERLRASADAHRRSLNGETIICLETVLLLPGKMAATERLARARAPRAGLSQGKLKASDIDGLERGGHL
jgi:antitoxin FitA